MKKEMKKINVGLNVIPLYDRVLIKESINTKENKTASGIIIPVHVGSDKGGKRGHVVAVGPGRFEEGKHIPINVKIGDEVFFQWGDKVEADSEEFYIVKEYELLAIIK